MSPKVTVICLKYGKRYHAEYVNKLFSMVSRNLSMPHEFVCLTEKSKGLNPNIRVIELKLKDGISGWWYKPFVFDPNLDLLGDTVLFLDLDIIVFDKIDKLFNYNPSAEFCGIRKFTDENGGGINSSCFRFKRESHYHLYDEYMNNHEKIIRKYTGDQDWMSDIISPEFWPRTWVQSFKYDMMMWTPNIRIPVERNKRTRKHIITEPPKIVTGSAIAVFHGEPKPHKVINKWCSENWQ